MGGGVATLFATDPPYLVDYTGAARPNGGKDWSEKFKEIDIKDPEEFMRDYLSMGLEVCTKNVAIYQWFAFKKYSMIEKVWLELGLLLHQQLVWVKPCSVLSFAIYPWKHEPCLFGWHMVDPKARAIVITEGEIDAMTLHQAGVAALSCNQGAGNHQWIDSDWERLQRFSDIVICYDADEAGQKGAAEVANRLGLDRVRIAKLPYKDANEMLLAGADASDFRMYIEQARPLDPDELVSASLFVDEVLRELYPSDDAPVAPALFVGMDHEWIRFRPGEVSVWTGFNGHGKSQFLGQAMLGMMRADERVLIFSGEMQPRRVLARMTRQAGGTDKPTVAYVKSIGRWFNDRLWVYKHVGEVSSARLLEVFAYGARRYGIRHFVIDSLMMLEDIVEEGRGALEMQRKFMVRIAAFAKQYGAHVHLVAHPKKGDDERNGPGKQEVSGSAKITNMADNVLSVWAKLRDEHDEHDGSPDGKVELLKQRNGESQHRTLWVWFDPRSMQYCCNNKLRPIQYAPFDQPATEHV
jgi:twinkle protein